MHSRLCGGLISHKRMPKQKGTKKEMTKNKRTAIGDKDKDITNNYKNIPNKLKQNP